MSNPKGSNCISSGARIGRKGMTLFGFFEKADGVKSQPLNSGSGTRAIDVLISNSQTVIPPSVHPDTGQPYVWQSRPLLDYPLDDLPRISAEKFRLLVAVVRSPEAEQISTGTATHSPGLSLVEQLVSITRDDSLIIDLFRALLPYGYSGDSLEQIDEWIRSAREKGFDLGTQSLPIDVLVARQVASDLDPLKYSQKDGFIQYRDGHWPAIEANDVRRQLKARLTERLGPKSSVATYLPRAEMCLYLDAEDKNFGTSRLHRRRALVRHRLPSVQSRMHEIPRAQG